MKTHHNYQTEFRQAENKLQVKCNFIFIQKPVFSQYKYFSKPFIIPSNGSIRIYIDIRKATVQTPSFGATRETRKAPKAPSIREGVC